LIGASVIAALLSNLGGNLEAIRYLFITEDIDSVNGFPFPEITHGQIWRLLTPIFIHFGLVHLLFNMIWLKDLGTAIELRLGAGFLLTFVAISGILSNLGECIFAGPLFGGMSGVVYALFGFVWMQAQFNPASGFVMPKNTIILMVAWFFICITGAIGPIGNFAHGVGLGVGVIWGFITARFAGNERRNSLQ
jgi:GlpG protein